MNLFAKITALTLCLCLSGSVALAEEQTPKKDAQQAEAKPSADKTSDQRIPQEKLQALAQLVRLTPADRQLPPEKAKAKFMEQLGKMIEMAAELEKQYPQAPETAVVRYMALRAAVTLNQDQKSDQAQATQTKWAKKVIDDENSPPEAEFLAGRILAEDELFDKEGNASEQAPKIIETFVKTYAKGPGSPYALMVAAQWADTAELEDQHKKYVQRLKDEFSDNRNVQQYLKYIGPKPIFTAELTTLDGKKLSLPKDAKGKVLVVDFWATWCGPCVASMPHMKEVYAKYKGKDVIVLGISLDRPNQKEKVQEFLKENDIGWLNVYSGKYWDDPTAKKYDINAIPAVWVVGKDGRVVDMQGRVRLQEKIEKALKM